MPEAYITLTPVHWFYLVGVLVILLTMILRRDTPLVCIVFLFGIGLVGQRSLAGGIQTIFSSIIYAISEFREVIATIALITAFSKCLQELGSDALLIKPVSKIMKTPAVSWWILGGIMFVFSLFLWPSPGSCTGRCDDFAGCSAVWLNTADSSYGNEPVWTWICPEL